jgi:hypothetical protein
MLHNEGTMLIFEHMTELLTPFSVKNTINRMKITDYKIFDITNCKTWKNKLLALEYAIVIRNYYQTATTRACNESIDAPAGQRFHN